MNDNYWLNLMTRFSVSGDTKQIPVDNFGKIILTKKKFYTAWALSMQNDLLKFESDVWVINQESRFIEYASMLFAEVAGQPDPTDPVLFSPGGDLQIEDSPFTKNLDIILQDVFGLVGYAALFIGFMTFSEEIPGNFIVDFIAHSNTDQTKLNAKFGIQDYSHGYVRYLDNLDLFFTDVFLNGFSHRFIDGTIPNNFIRPNREAFIDEYFETYQPISPLDFEDARDIFLEEYLSDYSDQTTKNKKRLIGISKISEFVVNKIDDIINIIFGTYGPYTLYNQFSEDTDIWESRTRKQAKNFFKIFLEKPTRDINFLGDLKKILLTRKDGFINLKASAAGGIGASRLYGGNELFQEGLKIHITFNELKKLAYVGKSGSFSDSILYVLQSATTHSDLSGLTPTHLNFRQFWELRGEDIGNKLIDAFTVLKSMFNRENLGAFYEKRLTVKFTNDGGGGITTEPISKRWKTFGFTKYATNIPFYANDLTSLHSAIASMLVYLLVSPDSFVDIKARTLSSFGPDVHIIFADLFNLFNPDYVQTTTLTSTIGGIFLWDQNTGGATRGNYNSYMSGFADIFDHSDQRHFLAFDTFDDILRILGDFFRNKIDRFIQIQDLRD